MTKKTYKKNNFKFYISKYTRIGRRLYFDLANELFLAVIKNNFFRVP